MDRKESRTKNSLLNFTSSIGGQLIMIIMQFIVRTVFIRKLGADYLGLTGLFSNILNLLSLAELGVGSAIVFRLYEPVAKDDRRRILILMNFYKKIYILIGVVVALIGLCLIPFLPVLIKDYSRLEELHINAVLIFCILLFQSAASYWFWAYKSIIIGVNQKEYLMTVIGYCFTVGSGIIQIICLYLYPNFLVYVLITVVSGIAQNILVAKLAEKKYPYIKERLSEKIDPKEAREIFSDCGALLLYKINSVVVKSTDNIVISSFLGLSYVALYSNYVIFFTTLSGVYQKIVSAVGHSLGNLHTTNDQKHEYEVYRNMMLLFAILGGTSFVGISAVSNEFIKTWLGEEWVISRSFAIILGMELYTSAFKYIISRYRTTMGLFQQAKLRPVAGMIINIVISIALVKPLGVTGVLIGTIASDWLTFMWYDPLIIHRIGFKNQFSVIRYYGVFIFRFLVCCLVCATDLFICSNVLVGFGWISVIVHALICGISTPLVLILISVKTPEGKYIIQLLSKIIRSVRAKIG